jgi:predicted TPR repeat methyltransferase
MGKVSYDAFADVYDLLMEDIDYVAWTTYLQKFLQRAPRKVRKITEAGCGTGSISIRLAQLGYLLTATDLSQEMLAVAAERARKQGVQIMFARQDIRQLTLGRCDALICACDVLNYIPQKQLPVFFEHAYAGLAKGGALLFDISSAYKLRHILGNQLFFEDREELSYFWRNHLQDEENKVGMELTFFMKKGQLYERRDEQQVQYIHETEPLLRALRQVGFTAQAYEFGTEQPPQEKSERIFFAAYKPTAVSTENK